MVSHLYFLSDTSCSASLRDHTHHVCHCTHAHHVSTLHTFLVLRFFSSFLSVLRPSTSNGTRSHTRFHVRLSARLPTFFFRKVITGAMSHLAFPGLFPGSIPHLTFSRLPAGGLSLLPHVFVPDINVGNKRKTEPCIHSLQFSVNPCLTDGEPPSESLSFFFHDFFLKLNPGAYHPLYFFGHLP